MHIGIRYWIEPVISKTIIATEIVWVAEATNAAAPTAEKIPAGTVSPARDEISPKNLPTTAPSTRTGIKKPAGVLALISIPLKINFKKNKAAIVGIGLDVPQTSGVR
mmetsp:Transcript_12492/g.12565  ORF Transcript_12492/g.12565 Transcript_12492/m.12565 type:complete len:107 (-) Transcript_12492:1131-1451(-)